MRRHALAVLATAVAPFFACSSSSSGGPGATSAPSATQSATVMPSASMSASAMPTTFATVCSLATPTLPDWRLTADGTQFRDSLHRVVLLRGVSAGGRSKLPPYVPFDFDPGGFDAALGSYMDRAASWGIDAVRAPFTWAAVEPTEGMDDEDFLSHYDAYIDAAWSRGIRVVVDFHQDVYAERLCGDGFPDWTLPDPKPAPMSDCPMWPLEYVQDADVMSAFDRFWASGSPVQASYGAMWDRMVARYKDRPGVVGFEPINEPASGSANSTTFEGTTLTDFYSTMVARIRGAAPTSLVFVDPTGIAGTFAVTGLQRPVGDGVVFAPHFYAAVGNSQAAVTQGLMTWSQMGVSWNVPVFVGEFGASHSRAGVVNFMNLHWNAFDALGLSATEWEYSVSTGSWNEETNTLVDAQGNELPVAAVVIRPFARAIAGDTITSAFDPATSTFTLSFTPTSGTSELSVPARAYPNGYDVAISGACSDASHDGSLLLSPAPSATSVTVTLTPKAAQ